MCRVGSRAQIKKPLHPRGRAGVGHGENVVLHQGLQTVLWNTSPFPSTLVEMDFGDRTRVTFCRLAQGNAAGHSSPFLAYHEAMRDTKIENYRLDPTCHSDTVYQIHSFPKIEFLTIYIYINRVPVSQVGHVKA